METFTFARVYVYLNAKVINVITWDVVLSTAVLHLTPNENFR